MLTLLARGLTNVEIAARLHLGEPTVRTHVGRIYAKAGVRDRAQAVVFAYESEQVRGGHASDVGKSPTRGARVLEDALS